jgi:putative DNA primase/helicase
MADLQEHTKRFINWHFNPDDLMLVVGIQKGALATTFVRTKDVQAFVDTVEKYNGVYNLYTIVNKLDDLNIDKLPTKTAENDEIIKYRSLYIDIDPIRKISKSGVSYAADNEESRRAQGAADKIYDLLKEYGFPDPLVCFTGNGYSLDYALDLPDYSPKQVRELFIEPINTILRAKFSSKASGTDGTGVDIDASVVNEARLRRIPGSLNVKGIQDEATLQQYPERIHRYSTVEYMPDKKEAVPLEVLQTFIDDYKNMLAPQGSKQSWPTIITDGMGRHKTLVKLAGYYRGVCAMEEPEIYELLKQYNANHIIPPKTDKEVRAIARKICKYEKCDHLQSIYDVYVDEVHLVNACINAYKDDIRYNIDIKKWMFWNGRYWEADDTGEIFRRIEQVIHDEILKYTGIAMTGGISDVQKARILGGSVDKKAVKNPIVPTLHKYDTTVQIERIERRLSKANGMFIKNEQLNIDVNMINLRNGVYDLNSGQLKPHADSKHHYITRIFNAEFDPDAKCPVFDRFMGEIMLNNKAMIDYVMKIYGWCLGGDTSYEHFFMLKGAGCNGKSVLGESLLYIFGDYGKSTSYDTWISGNNKCWEMAQLPGIRYINCSEVPPHCRLNTPLIKKFVSGDMVTAEAKYVSPFNFKPQGKLIFLVNHIPYINDLSNATLRRLVIVPFDFVPDNKDIHLRAKIIVEANGILNRLLEGYYSLRNNGFEQPPEVVHEQEELIFEMDWLSAFLKSEFEFDKNAMETNEAIDHRYRVWAELNNEDETRSLRAILKVLREKGYQKYRVDGKQYIKGLRLKTDTVAAEKVSNFEEQKKVVESLIEKHK